MKFQISELDEYLKINECWYNKYRPCNLEEELQYIYA